MAKVAILRVSDTVFAKVLKQGHIIEVLANGLPEDAQIINITHDPYRHHLLLLLTSEEFAVVPDGEPIPELSDITLKSHR